MNRGIEKPPATRRILLRSRGFYSTTHWDVKGCFPGTRLGRFYGPDNSVPEILKLLILGRSINNLIEVII
jgi:hypothetical protein